MSDAVLRAALDGAAGPVDLAVRIGEAPLQGMITLRGDLSSVNLKKAATDLAGVDMPGVRRIARTGDKGLAWMSTDELLLFVPYAGVGAALKTLAETLAGEHHMAIDVSDARAMFHLTGAGAREVLAKGAPVDLSSEAFGVGDFRRTRIGQIAAAFGQVADDPETFELICFRSVGRYMFDWLCTSARAGSLPEVL